MTAQVDSYEHTQRAPLCLMLYGLALAFLVAAWATRGEVAMVIVFLSIGLLALALAPMFHHLTIADRGEKLSVSFGPLPVFRRSVSYDDIVSAEVGRTTILDGWGIHLSLGGGWVWNIWGRDCVILRLRKGRLQLGTDDAANLSRFVRERLARKGQS